MNKKKRRVAVLLSATIGSAVLVLSGCSGKSDQTEKTLRVGVITYTQDDPFINGLTDELKAQLKAMENKERRIIVSTKSGNDDQQEQNEKVEEMIDAGCDVLCINLVDRTAPSRIIRMARNEDIPVIFFNREPVREDLMQWEKLYYVGCDAEQSGIMQGEIAEEYIKSHPEVDKNQDGKIQYVLLEGEAGHQDAISRTEYSVKTLMKNDVILEKLSYQLADWNRGQAENRMNRLISQYGKKIELVMSNNDEMALGAVEAYRKAGYVREEWPVIFGIDGLEEALEAVKAVGNMDEDDGGMIIVSGKKKDEDILITIEDNGMGMREEVLENILTDNSKVPKHGSGVGVINVHSRIRLMFGEEYGLSIESEPDEGTRVTIRIPAIPYTPENAEALELQKYIQRRPGG